MSNNGRREEGGRNKNINILPGVDCGEAVLYFPSSLYLMTVSGDSSTVLHYTRADGLQQAEL